MYLVCYLSVSLKPLCHHLMIMHWSILPRVRVLYLIKPHPLSGQLASRMSEQSKAVEQPVVSSGQSSPSVGAPGYKFPDALLKSPRCLIALSGLDARNNAVHRMVWDEFTTGSRRAERKPILYKHFPANHIYAATGSNSVSIDIIRPGQTHDHKKIHLF